MASARRRMSFYEYNATTRLLPLKLLVAVTQRLQAAMEDGLICFAMADTMDRIFVLHAHTGDIMVSQQPLPACRPESPPDGDLPQALIFALLGTLEFIHCQVWYLSQVTQRASIVKKWHCSPIAAEAAFHFFFNDLSWTRVSSNFLPGLVTAAHATEASHIMLRACCCTAYIQAVFLKLSMCIW